MPGQQEQDGYARVVTVNVIGTGVTLRLPDPEELQAIERTRAGGEFELPRSHSYTEGPPPGPDEVYVVSQAFVEFADDDGVHRWGSYEHHGATLPTDRDATFELLQLAHDTARDLVEDLMSDMRIEGLSVSRWEFVSAPRRFELAPELEARLAPLRRG
jgi:hypothetical protein